MQLGVIEARFADIIWQNAPISSAELAKKAESALGWKKTTSYTVLKRLCDKGLFENNKGTVSVIISREEFYSRRSEQLINEEFGGSLPAFLAAFTARKSLSDEDVKKLKKLIEGR